MRRRLGKPRPFASTICTTPATTTCAERYGLSAQMTVRLLAKVADAYKLDRKRQRVFHPHGSIAYDNRILAWKLDAQTVRIWTIAGRQTIFVRRGRAPACPAALHARRSGPDLPARREFYPVLQL